ncbi:hypothetical protein MXD60_28450, partial [Frankia sp. AgB32]
AQLSDTGVLSAIAHAQETAGLLAAAARRGGRARGAPRGGGGGGAPPPPPPRLHQVRRPRLPTATMPRPYGIARDTGPEPRPESIRPPVRGAAQAVRLSGQRAGVAKSCVQ